MTPTARYHTVEYRHEPTHRIVLRRMDGGGGEPVVLDAGCLLAQYVVSGTDTLLVLDHVTIGAPYATDTFRPVELAIDMNGRRGIGGLLAPRHIKLDRSEEAVLVASVQAVR